MFQILTSPNAHTEELVRQLQELSLPWLDLNIGCPSNTVCKNQGGSHLLKDLMTLKKIIKLIRTHFRGRFSCKVRIGYSNTDLFEELIKMLNDEGVELITVHARTREDLYKNPARWEFITQAVKFSQVPIIGNGDIWETHDISRMLETTGCHGVMIARGALKTPWMARDYKKKMLSPRLEELKVFYTYYQTQLVSNGITQRGLLKQKKSLSRFIFDDIIKIFKDWLFPLIYKKNDIYHIVIVNNFNYQFQQEYFNPNIR
jgi:tRNA-dihydrouridine synthase